MIFTSIAAEGMCNVIAIEKIAVSAGFTINTTIDTRGKSKLDRNLDKYITAGIHTPWIISRDLDRDADCAPTFLNINRVISAKFACFCLSVRSLEAWLMADAENLADWLGVSPRLIPPEPELVANPKIAIANLANRSRKRAIQERMAPRPVDGASIGAEYGAAVYEFVKTRWDPHNAAAGGLSPSLTRAIQRIGQLHAIASAQ